MTDQQEQVSLVDGLARNIQEVGQEIDFIIPYAIAEEFARGQLEYLRDNVMRIHTSVGRIELLFGARIPAEEYGHLEWARFRDRAVAQANSYFDSVALTPRPIPDLYMKFRDGSTKYLAFRGGRPAMEGVLPFHAYCFSRHFEVPFKGGAADLNP